MSEKMYGVIGSPVRYSRSPQLFQALFQRLRMDAHYSRISADSAEEGLKLARALDFSGLNVTSPLKVSMIDHLDELDAHAEKIGAVNTVVFRNRKTVGYNTDFLGVIESLGLHGVRPAEKTVIVLGAGGAARAAVHSMKLLLAKKIIVISRTVHKARALASSQGCHYAHIQKLPEILTETDILINCVPKSLIQSDFPFSDRQMVLFDANYRNPMIQSARVANNTGISLIGGLDWLLFQAFASFQIYSGFNIPPHVKNEISVEIKGLSNPSKPHIAMVGFMGAGKTSIGRKLAEELKLTFVDTDLVLEHQLGHTIPEIFKKYGEKGFRRYESAAIEKVVTDSSKKVISFGGGAVLDKKNREIIRENCFVLWLWASVPESIKRTNPTTRPLLQFEDPVQGAEALMSSRKTYYARLGDLVFSTEGQTPEEGVRRIRNELDQTI